MKKSQIKRINALAQSLGLKIDEPTQVIYGEYNGYTLWSYCKPTGYLEANFCVTSSIGKIDPKALKRGIKNQTGAVVTTGVNGYCVTVRARRTSFVQKEANGYKEAVVAATNYFRANGLSNCDQVYGSDKLTSVCFVDNEITILNEDSIAAVKNEIQKENIEQNGIVENKPAGVIGAVIGGIVGAAIMCFALNYGKISALTGVVMAYLVLHLYERFAGKTSRFGIRISIAIVIVMIYLADRFYFAYEIKNLFNNDLLQAFKHSGFLGLSSLEKHGMLKRTAGVFAGYLVLLYLAASWDCIPYIKEYANKKRFQRTFRLFD